MHAALRTLSAVALLAVAACAPHFAHQGPPGPPPIPYGQATETQIEHAMDRYSSLMLAMDASGLASMYAPDGVMERQSGNALHGRDEIRTVLASAGNVRVLSNQMTTISIAYNGPAVVQTGEFHQSARVNGKVVNAAGRFEATWVRGPHGEWFIERMVTYPAGN